MAAPTITDVRWAEAKVATAREQLAALEAELAAIRAAAGLRPADGSDQPGLFQTDMQDKLF